MVFSQEKLIAKWNPARSAWETGEMTLFCSEHSAVFSETWPSSGMMRDGVAYEPVMSEPLIAGSESSFSLLPTSTARDWKGIPGKNVQMASLPREISLLPTPNTMDDLPPKSREKIAEHRDARVRKALGKASAGDRNLREAVLYELDVEPQTRWGRYEEAIRRWEVILGRPAPEPTEPGKNGNPRLNPELPEWMMGLPEGWVTGVPELSRHNQLKAIGNGCVPQQAAAALRLLLE